MQTANAKPNSDNLINIQRVLVKYAPKQLESQRNLISIDYHFRNALRSYVDSIKRHSKMHRIFFNKHSLPSKLKKKWKQIYGAPDKSLSVPRTALRPKR